MVDSARNLRIRSPGPLKTLRQAVFKHWPSLTVESNSQLKRFLDTFPPGARILDVGAGHFRHRSDIITLDPFRTEGADVIGNGENLPFQNDSLDAVVCVAVLEHVPDPAHITGELLRVLKPGGAIYLEVPFIEGYHAAPGDYWRWTLDGLKHFAAGQGIEEQEAGADMGPASAWCWITHDFVVSWFDSWFLSRLASRTMRLLLAPVKYLDFLMVRKKRLPTAAASVYLWGRKPCPKGRYSALNPDQAFSYDV